MCDDAIRSRVVSKNCVMLRISCERKVSHEIVEAKNDFTRCNASIYFPWREELQRRNFSCEQITEGEAMDTMAGRQDKTRRGWGGEVGFGCSHTNRGWDVG